MLECFDPIKTLFKPIHALLTIEFPKVSLRLRLWICLRMYLRRLLAVLQRKWYVIGLVNDRNGGDVEAELTLIKLKWVNASNAHWLNLLFYFLLFFFSLNPIIFYLLLIFLLLFFALQFDGPWFLFLWVFIYELWLWIVVLLACLVRVRRMFL